MIEKQGSDFRLVAPDEPDARAAYEAEHPEQVDRRSDLLTSTAVIEMFPEEEEDNEEERDDDLDEEAVADLGETEVNA